MYYHGEEIGVNVHIANSSSRTCKKIKVTSKRIGGKKYSKFIYFGFLFVSLFFSSSSLFVFFFPIANFVSTAFERQISQSVMGTAMFSSFHYMHCGILRKPQAL